MIDENGFIRLKKYLVSRAGTSASEQLTESGSRLLKPISYWGEIFFEMHQKK